jgi:CheY-like chemotaxis protein
MTTDGNLLRALVHELRNSIAPLVNAVHLIRLRGPDRELLPILDIIERQTASMARTMDAIVEADRLQRGDISLKSDRIDLGEVIESAVRSAWPLIESRRQHLHFSPPPGPVWIEGDPARLAQALANVLDNAARYTDEGGDISIEIDTPAKRAEIRIRDNGRGIAREALPGIFESFAQSSPARGGAGVGLTIARRVCELHRGHIVAASEGEGRGSTFVISIPLAVEAGDSPENPFATPAAATRSARRAPDGARRILVADDNEAMRNSFAAILRELGHDVKLAADGVQALQAAESWAPEFVILDVHMPKVNGYDVARRLRSRFPSEIMRLVMMSGTDLDQTTLRAAKEAGFDYCIDKTLAVRGIEALLHGDEPSLERSANWT